MEHRNPQSDLGILIRLTEESYNRKSWHGPNLRSSIRGITPKEAAWRPQANRHNIWELIVHCAYWKYTLRRRILREPRGSFPLEGSNWFKRPLSYARTALSHDIALLDETHKTMVEAIKSFDPEMLWQIPKNSKVSYDAFIRGVALHDVYHAGQIQLLKKLMK